MKLPINLFTGAGATGHVFFLKKGTQIDMGLAFSGLVLPTTTVAVVPTTSRTIDFSVESRTSDKQDIRVLGNIKVSLKPGVALPNFDFTVNPRGGNYLSNWEKDLRAIVVEHVLGPIHEQAKVLDVETATVSHKNFAEEIRKVLDGESTLLKKGIVIDSCSITNITACDEDVSGAIGSKERQDLLAASDKAIHMRRLKGAENDRAVRTYEAETNLKLEEERSKLLEKEGENARIEAETDAAATKIRLEPLNEVEAGKIMGAAIMEMAKTGRVGNLSIVPELLTALKG